MNYKPVTDKYSAPCANYLFNALFHPEGALTNAANTITRGFITDIPDKYKKFKFDTIVCSGISGIVFGLPLARRMGIKLAIVRKDDDSTHSTNSIESDCYADEIGKYIIVDDLVESGATIKRIVAAMKTHCGHKAKHVATYLYDRGYLNRP